MGIKGCYSLLSNEPTRFGHQWSSADENDVDVYIDAPALLHHLIYCFQRNCDLPPSIQKKDFEDHFGTGVLSPCMIYRLVRAFISYLREALHNNNSTIHFVFDGVASITKEKQQVERLGERCLVYDEATRCYLRGEGKREHEGGNTNHKKFHVTHLFSEDAVVEAAKSEAMNSNEASSSGSGGSSGSGSGGSSSKVEVHFADSEAEVFIADLISRSMAKDDNNNLHAQQRRMIVLSSDSDFLVYPSVPSFTPLNTLQYSLDEEGRKIIMGWCYSKSQFLAAYPLLGGGNDDSESLRVFSTIAALAGCDYTLSSSAQARIESARRIIVKSSIGGLRQRDQNKPSARGQLQAVLRYICHFRRKHSGACDDGWMTSLVKNIVCAEGGKHKEARQESLVNALGLIKNIYLGRNIANMNILCPNEMVDLRRLLVHQTLYLRPIMESCDCAPAMDKEQRNYTAGRCGQSGSIWMSQNFVRFRDQIYSFLAYKNKILQHGNQIEEKNFTCHAVTEYCRVGRGRQTAYKSFEVKLSENHDASPGDASVHSLQTLIHMITKEKNREKEVEMCLNQLPEKYYTHFFALMLLDYERKVDALLLVIAMFVPVLSANTLQQQLRNIPCPIQKSERKEYLQSSGHILAAIYHAKLAVDTVMCYSSRCGKSIPTGSQTFSLPFSALFCDACMTVMYSIITKHHKSNLGENAISDIQEKVRSVLRLDRDHWDGHAEMIWSTWLKVKGRG